MKLSELDMQERYETMFVSITVLNNIRWARKQ